MNQIIKTGFQPITHMINLESEKIRKGKDLSTTHVKRVEELHELGTCKFIHSSYIRSYAVTKKPYTVNLNLDDNRMVTHSSCSCVSGVAGKCKHIYALIHYVNTDRGLTKTSYEQGWSRPSDAQLGKDMYANPLVLAEKYVANDNFAYVEPYEVTVKDLAEIDCPLRNILKVEATKKEDLIAIAQAKALLKEQNKMKDRSDIRECVMMLIESGPREEELYRFNLPTLNLALQEFFNKKIKMTNHQVFEACLNIVDQSENDLWFNVRHIRISASSSAHKIKSKTRKGSEDLAKDFLNNNNNKLTTATLEYGKKMRKKQ